MTLRQSPSVAGDNQLLDLHDNQLTIVPAEIGQLTSLEKLHLHDKLAGGDRAAEQLPLRQSAKCGGDRAAHVAGAVGPPRQSLTIVPAEIGQLTSLDCNQLTSLPAEIWQLTSLKQLHLSHNQLTSVPAEIGQLTSLERLFLHDNQLMSVPAAIRELRAAGCQVLLDVGVTTDE